MEWVAVIGNVLGAMAMMVVWFYTIWRTSVDDRLQSQVRKIMPLAILLAPHLGLGYWIPLWFGKPPFWVDEESSVSV